MTSPKDVNLPRWDLSNVYPGLESEALAQDRQRLDDLLKDLEAFVAKNKISRLGRLSEDPAEVSQVISGFLERMNAVEDLFETLESYLRAFVTVDSYNQTSARLVSLLDPQKVRLEKSSTLFHGWLGSLADVGEILNEAIEIDKTAAAHSFYIREEASHSKYLMSEDEESLAAELSLSGANAWTKLQRVIISQLKAPFEKDGRVEELSLSLISTYTSDPDEATRKQAYKAMNSALSTAREPLAACLNGIKGAAHTIDNRRGREDAVHASLDIARIDRQILETLLTAMESAFPMSRRYLKAKARLLGKKKLENWDLPAPIGNADRRYDWHEGRTFILTNFATYSPKLEALARRTFDEGWIDAEPRDGKRVGAFCMRLPAVEESRIFLNYDGRLGRLTTFTHELGHAYHNECLRGKTNLQAQLPMTLAETASIFCENIVTDAIMEQADEVDEELAILDSFLLTAVILTLDISARYHLETEIFKQRAEVELSADDFCKLCSDFYRDSFGDALADGEIRPYSWAFLPHYYLADLPFYNYPYTFGFLFSLGLYQRYKEGQPGFHLAYDKLLAETGMSSASDLGRRMGIDIYDPDFWAGGYDIVRTRVERYEELVRVKTGE
jgi:pepF/M3 family oligoendopeptidase